MFPNQKFKGYSQAFVKMIELLEVWEVKKKWSYRSEAQYLGEEIKEEQSNNEVEYELVHKQLQDKNSKGPFINDIRKGLQGENSLDNETLNVKITSNLI